MLLVTAMTTGKKMKQSWLKLKSAAQKPRRLATSSRTSTHAWRRRMRSSLLKKGQRVHKEIRTDF